MLLSEPLVEDHLPTPVILPQESGMAAIAMETDKQNKEVNCENVAYGLLLMSKHGYSQE